MLTKLMVIVLFGLGNCSIEYPNFVSVDYLYGPFFKMCRLVDLGVIVPFLVIKESKAFADTSAFGLLINTRTAFGAIIILLYLGVWKALSRRLMQGIHPSISGRAI